MATISKSALHGSALSANPFIGKDGHALVQGMESWISATSMCQREMIAFMTARLEKDRQLINDLQRTKDLARSMELQSRWAAEAIQDYATETTRIFSIYWKAEEGSARPGHP